MLAWRPAADSLLVHLSPFFQRDDADTGSGHLAALLDISNPGGTKIVGELVAAGYVERVPDPADGRARQLHLTARGRAALATARRFHAGFERRLAGEHGTDQVATVRAVLAGYLDGAGAETELARSLRPL